MFCFVLLCVSQKQNDNDSHQRCLLLIDFDEKRISFALGSVGHLVHLRDSSFLETAPAMKKYREYP